MNRISLLLVVGLVAPQMLLADAGLFDISRADQPKPLPDKIDRVTIFSESNNNKHFYLSLHAATFFSLPCSQIGLVVGTNTVRFCSQSPGDKGHSTSMETTVDDPELISQIAQFFHAKITMRQHPGHRMLVEFIPDKTEFALGEAVIVKLRITNIGEHDFAFMEGGRQRGSRDNQFAFSAELMGDKMISDTGDPRNFGGLAGPVTLKPGQSHEIVVDLTRWFDFKQAGTYNLRGSYYMSFVEPGSQDLYPPIWEDYACAEFTISIKS